MLNHCYPHLVGEETGVTEVEGNMWLKQYGQNSSLTLSQSLNCPVSHIPKIK